MSSLVHALSLDVEDYANGEVLRTLGRITPPTPSVVRFTEEMLSLFAEFDTKATCFILGEVAAAFPGLVRMIHAEGHEIGVHGWHHHRVFQLDADKYRESLHRAKSVLEDLSGHPVLGYRAVAMSITRSTWWAYDVLGEVGFRYSSSILPFYHPTKGVFRAPVGPHVVKTSNGIPLLEIPLTTVKLGLLRLPALGGGYLRHLPLAYNRLALRSLRREGRRAVVYLHPYELDAAGGPERFGIELSREEMRKLRQAAKSQLRNRRHTGHKVRELLRMDSFAPMRVAFQEEIEALDAPGTSGES